VILARRAFDIAENLGHALTLLDIGGGFPGFNQPDQEVSFKEIAAALAPVIDELFPPHIRVIAEPGRYLIL
jgi:ornithine decarboxylase